MTVFLYGPPASGKTTLGRRLASAIGGEFTDLDETIVAAAGKPIPEIFAESGEAVFRKLESQALEQVSAAVGKFARSVVALGGGTLLDEKNRALCERVGSVICLEAPSADELKRRLEKDGRSRPLGDKSVERAAHYSSFPARLAASFDLENSLVLVGRAIAPTFLEGLPCVVDENVRRLHGERLSRVVDVIPSGETHKTIATVTGIWRSLAKAGLGRRDTVAAVGGGVTGDLTGFAAATFMRGIDWINVPTTLLSMVDASTGGKTGFDLDEGKNLVGAFHAPQLVVVDVDFLSTLTPELIAEGRAEMIKHELVGGRLGCRELTAAALARNLAIKIGIVREDPFERTGRRLLLNCGHTIAHAVEKCSNYAISHGAAVAIGCVAEARIAARLRLTAADWPERLARVFADEGLPTELPSGMNPAMLVPVMKGDKKRHGDVVTFALPCGWGDVRAVRIDLSKEVGIWS